MHSVSASHWSFADKQVPTDGRETSIACRLEFALRSLWGSGNNHPQGDVEVAQSDNYSLAADKERLLSQVRASLEFLPDDAEEAEILEPWLFSQLNQFLQTVKRSDLELTVLTGLVGLLVPTFSALLPGPIIGDPPGKQAGLPTLRIVV